MNSKSYPIKKEQIAKAHQQIKPFINYTPVLSSESLNRMTASELYFKCENFQKVGAFKMRGATNAILQLSESQLNNGVTTHSSGNHAQAVAKAANFLNVPAYIVMPSNAPKVKIAAVQEYGGQITFCEPNLQAREEEVNKIIESRQATFIPPYDHEDVICGQATAAKEVFEQVEQADVLICPVGGGGLLAGSILAAHYFGNNTVVYGAEPKGADDAFQSIKEHRLIPQTNPKTIADGLLTSLGKLNFEIIHSGVEAILTVSDREIIEAMQLIWERMKIIVEPSCAVPLAAIMGHKALFENKKVVIILSGGNVDLDKFFNSFY